MDWGKKGTVVRNAKQINNFIEITLKINNTEYLNSQYADDSALTLADDLDNLRAALDCIYSFAHWLVLKQTLIKHRQFRCG